MDLKVVGSEVWKWLELPQNRDQWQDFVWAVLEICDYIIREFVTVNLSWITNRVRVIGSRCWLSVFIK